MIREVKVREVDKAAVTGRHFWARVEDGKIVQLSKLVPDCPDYETIKLYRDFLVDVLLALEQTSPNLPPK